MDAQSLLNSLDPLLLTAEASPLVMWDVGITDDPEKIVQYMYHGGPLPPQASSKPPRPHHEDPRPDRKYWEYVKTEMRIFLCTDDKKYRDLWKQIKASGERSTTVVVGIMLHS